MHYCKERCEVIKIIKKKINISDELKTDKLIYRVPTFYFTIYTEVKEEPKPKKEEYIIENIAKALEENIECLMKVKNKFHYLGYFEDKRAIGTKIEYLKLQNTILKNIYLILKMRKTMPTKHCLS